jgi:hypothetical protein
MKIFLFFIFQIFISMQMLSQHLPQSESQITVEALMAVQEAKWNDGNIDGFMNLYWNNDSLKFIGKKGITYGWKKTLDNYKKSYPTKIEMGILNFTILDNIQVGENYIYIIGKWELKKENSVSGHFTLLWKKINEDWVIVSDHTS